MYNLFSGVIYLKIVGLCGGSGVGKGYVGNMFSARGIPVIDTDAVYHDMISHSTECLKQITDVFGGGVLRSDGALDRSALSRIVFSDKSKHEVLNAITHKHILAKTRQIIKELSAAGKKCVIVDAPMLFESGFDAECDMTLGVVADTDIRIGRITERDGISSERAAARISNQLS